MKRVTRHYDPLRPNRAFSDDEKYEFTHGTESVCVFDIKTMDFIKEIPVGKKPDCHATSVDNRHLYIACEDGLYCINQDMLEVVKIVKIGHVYGTNVMPDGNTMLLHDAYGGIFVLRGIQDMGRIHVHKRINVLGRNEYMHTLGGKGHFLEEGRYYLCNAWKENSIYIIDIEEDYTFSVFIEDERSLKMGDDLVTSRDRTKAYTACYSDVSHVAVTDIKQRKVVKSIRTGRGTCGLTMTNDERYVVASNDADDSISVIDTIIDEVVSTVSARNGFKKMNIAGYIQGISAGTGDEIFVYGCSGNGALVRFSDVTGQGRWVISYPGGKCESAK